MLQATSGASVTRLAPPTIGDEYLRLFDLRRRIKRQLALHDDALHRLINLLDELDGDPDLERAVDDGPCDEDTDAELTANETHGRGFPSHGGLGICGWGGLDDTEDDDPGEDDGTAEYPDARAALPGSMA